MPAGGRTMAACQRVNPTAMADNAPSEPAARRLRLPAAYGAPADTPLMAWQTVRARLEAAPHYWLSTADAAGVPLARPLDGVWLDDALWFGGDPAARWRRNLAGNPNACLTLEDAGNPVIVEGAVAVIAADRELAAAIAEATHAKYGWGSAEQYEAEVCAFAPRVAIAWTGLFQQATRFRFPDS